VSGDSHELEPDFYRLSAFDMSKTRAFALTASSNGIHIVVRGRRGEDGIPPEDYERFRSELKDALLTQCLDPETGERIVSEVWTREQVFAGPKMELAPDLTLTLRDHSFFSVRRGDTILRKRPRIMGTHHPEGIFIAGGPGIRQGNSVGSLQLVDIAPTILYSLGIPVPEDLEGTVLEPIFTPEHLRANVSARSGPTFVNNAADSEAETPSDDSAILEKLKALGYIE
jgi:predicted AlkP superfamily phosphohydrolase/phosphomutase